LGVKEEVLVIGYLGVKEEVLVSDVGYVFPSVVVGL
jgi:hypothetical protein